MKKTYNKILIFVLAIIIPITVLIAVVQYYTFNESFYMKEFDKYNIGQVTGISENNLNTITEKLTGYLEDSQEDLIIRADVNGIEEQIFEDRELKHMVDVKIIFLQINKLKYFLAALILIVSVSQILQKETPNIGKGFIGASILFSVVLVLLSFMIFTDFSKYFTKFHEIFFTNDLWLLDPRTDILIQMLPLDFFIDVAVRIVARTGVIIYGCTGILSMILRRKND